MTIKHTLIILALGASVIVSCKKKDEPAPAAPVVVATGSGTFKVNNTTQTPTVFTRKVYTAAGVTFTQVTAQNDKYNIKMEFTNATLSSGNYTITQTFLEGNMNVAITLSDLIGNKVYLSDEEAIIKVKVDGKKITLPTITIDNNPVTTISADITLP